MCADNFACPSKSFFWITLPLILLVFLVITLELVVNPANRCQARFRRLSPVRYGTLLDGPGLSQRPYPISHVPCRPPSSNNFRRSACNNARSRRSVADRGPFLDLVARSAGNFLVRARLVAYEPSRWCEMKASRKQKSDPAKSSVGKHGGNRAGGRNRRAKQPKRSSQAAGKDPARNATRKAG
jgi:hypothetical protein